MDTLYDWVMAQNDILVLWFYLALFAVFAVVVSIYGLFSQAWNALKRSFRRYIRRVVHEELDDR